MEPHVDADVAVTLDEDRPGTLARALSCVAAAGLNIDGYAEMNGIVHMLSPDLRAVHDCLQAGGFRIRQEQAVLVVPVADRPGAAAGVFQQLGEAHINIKYSYLATGNRLVIAVQDANAALAVLSGARPDDGTR